MAHRFQVNMEFPESGADVVVGEGELLDISRLEGAGYDYIRDPAAAFTATLQGSVAGLNWTDVAALGASAQNTIAAHYNWLRIRCTTGNDGAKGATTQLKVAGTEVA